MGGELAAFALLQAANLKETLDITTMSSLTMEDAGKRIDDAENLIETLLPRIEQNISSYSFSTQCAIVSALAQLEHYSEVICSSVASTSCRLADATGGVAEALSSSGGVRIIDPTSSANTAPVDESGILGMQLMMMACSFGQLGHYESDLFHLIAKQTVVFADSSFSSSAGLSHLVNILGAFMDVQHFDQDLLLAVGKRVADDMSGLSIEEAASVLLIFSFFNVRNSEFYTQLLALIGSKQQTSAGTSGAVDPRTAALIYRGIKLLPEPLLIPQTVTDILEASLVKYGPLALSTMVPAIRDLEALRQMDSEMDDDSLLSVKAYQIAIMRDIHSILKNVVESDEAGAGGVAKFEVAMSDGWLISHISVHKQGHKISYQVIGDDLVCSNDPRRFKGQVQSELLVMQRAGWAVVVLTVNEWMQMGRRIVEEDRDQAGGLELILEELDSKTREAIKELAQIDA